MSKKLLIETRMNSLSLCENKDSKKIHPGCLGTLSGPCADYKNPTRNNNMYGKKLWENVFNDPIVKESLEDRILIGELDHPGDRLETKATNAAIVMTDYEFDDSKGLLNGTFDILDTPNGRILKSLLDYGCKIGVSSRGEGDVVEKEGVDYVDEDSFTFVGFDAVVLPAVKAAKPALQESLKHESLKESLTKEIDNASTQSELDLIKKVVEATEMPDSDSLIESINNKSQKLSEGTTSSSNLLEDLENATSRIKELEKENRSLKSSLTTSKSKINKLMNRIVSINSDSKTKAKSFENLNNKYNRLMKKMTTVTENFKSLSESNRRLNGEMTEFKEKYNSLSEKFSLEKKNSRRLESQLSKSESLKESYKSKVDDLSESYESKISRLEDQIDQLNEDLRINSSESDNEIKSLNLKLESMTQKYNSSLKSYAEVKAKSSGIDPNYLNESLGNKSSIKKIDEAVNLITDRDTRYKTLPITRDSLLESYNKATMVSEISETDEDAQSRKFMEQFYNQNLK